MRNQHRQWKMHFLTRVRRDEPDLLVTIYGETHMELMENIQEWLRNEVAHIFCDEEHQYYYIDYDGLTSVPGILKESIVTSLSPGWYLVNAPFPASEITQIQKLSDFEEALTHFMQHAFLPVKGPDYHDLLDIQGTLPLYLIHTIRVEQDYQHVNRLLKRGWYLLDYASSRVFTLGHPEEDAF